MATATSASFASVRSRSMSEYVTSATDVRDRRRRLEQSEPAREEVGNDGGEHEPDPERDREHAKPGERLREFVDRPRGDDLESDARDGEHDTGLHRPQHTPVWRAHRPWRRIHRDRRRFEEAAAR